MSQGRFAEVKAIMKTCAKINGKEFPEHLLPQLEVIKVYFFLTLISNNKSEEIHHKTFLLYREKWPKTAIRVWHEKRPLKNPTRS